MNFKLGAQMTMTHITDMYGEVKGQRASSNLMLSVWCLFTHNSPF